MGTIASCNLSSSNGYTAFYMELASFNTSPCLPSGGTRVVRYHNGSNTNPVAGDTIYEDDLGNTVFDGGGYYHHLGAGMFDNDNTIQVSSLGIVQSNTDCTL